VSRRVVNPLFAFLVVASVSAATVLTAPTGAAASTNPSALGQGSAAVAGARAGQPALSAAPSPAARALATAQATGGPVEVPSLDNATTVTYANPDGTMTAHLSAGPVRVQQNGQWVPVDPTLVAANGTVAPKAVAGAPSFAGALGAGGGTLASVGVGSNRLAYRWSGALPAPTLSGNTATYPNVVPNGDLVLTATTRGFEVSLLLHKAPAAALTLRLPVSAGGLNLTQAGNGDLNLTDPTGRTVARAPAPTMCAAGTDARSGLPNRCQAVSSTLVAGPSGQELDITPDQVWLTDPATTYPVTLDPATNLSDTLDDYVSSTYASTNYDGSAELHVGSYNGGADKNRTFIQVNDSAIKGQSVTSATLNAYEIWSYSCTDTEMIVEGAFGMSPGRTWNTQPGVDGHRWGDSYFHGGYSGCPSTAGWKAIPITGLVQGWSHNGAASPEALAMLAPNETDDNQWKRFNSGNTTTGPYVSVDYTTPVPPNTPTNLAPPAGTSGTSLTPALSAKASDPNGTATRLDFQVFVYGGGPLVASGSASNVANGGTGSFTVPSGALRAGQHYAWHVRAFDGQQYSGYSPYADFTANVPPNTPTNLAPPAGTTATASLTPALSAKASDPNGTATRLDFQVFVYGGGPLVASGSASNVANGGTGSFTVPSGALRAGQHYGWHVRAFDGQQYSSYSPYADFTADPSVCRVLSPVSVTTDIYGGTDSAFKVDAGSLAHQRVPAAGFSPLLAPDAQLAFYGFRPRPADPAMLATWTRRYQGFTAPAKPGLCVRDALSNAVSDPKSNWSGPETNSGSGNSFDDTHGFTSAAADFTQPGFTADCQHNSALSIWSGIGGDPSTLSSGGQAALVQTGTESDGDISSPITAWWERIGLDGSDSKQMSFQYFSVTPGDYMSTYTNYNVYGTSGGNVQLSMYDQTTGHSDAMYFDDPNYNYWSSTTAEFINERTSFGGVYPDLRDYDHTDWQNAAVGQEGTNGGSMQSLGAFGPTSVGMTSTDPSGPELAHVDGGQVTGDSFTSRHDRNPDGSTTCS